jgi:hypothetical protein
VGFKGQTRAQKTRAQPALANIAYEFFLAILGLSKYTMNVSQIRPFIEN